MSVATFDQQTDRTQQKITTSPPETHFIVSQKLKAEQFILVSKDKKNTISVWRGYTASRWDS